MNNKQKQSGFAHVALLLVIIVIIVAIVGVGAIVLGKQGVGPLGNKAPSTADKTAKFVTASPLDPEQIASISKFRSCSGHDYSGKDVDGVVETERSMKNYAIPIKSLEGTKGQVKIYAPFDAVVINNSEGKKGDNLDLSPTAAPGWVYELGHISSDKNLPEGTKVKAGDLIGYYDENGAFDLQFWYGGKQTVNTLQGYFDSLFAHMTPELEKQLDAYGLTPANLIVSKESRDAEPCKGSRKEMGSTIFTGDITKDQVTVKNKAALSAPAQPVQGTNNNTAGNPGSTNSGTNECALPVGQRPPGCN
jgi:hypothetical protein